MKTLAFILAFSLFGGAVKGTPIVQVVKTVIGLDGCHQVDSSDTCHNDEEQSDNCCGDIGCECTCCVHIMIANPLVDFDFTFEDFADSSYGYAWGYQRDYSATTFHPPTLG